MPQKGNGREEKAGRRVPRRQLKEGFFRNENVSVAGQLHDEQRLRGWLEQQLTELQPDGDQRLCWLLAFADDGVIWGRVDDGGLELSSNVAPDVSPLLRFDTLQELRLFCQAGELLLWKDGSSGEWRARVLRDEEGAGDGKRWYFDEEQILWGTKGKLVDNCGFTRMSDGEQGMVHVVPLDATGKWDVQSRPLRLKVRHYVKAGEDNLLRVVASRLVDVCKQPKGKKGDDKDGESSAA